MGTPLVLLSPSLEELLDDEREDEEEDCEPERLELGMLGMPPGSEALAPGSEGMDDELLDVLPEGMEELDDEELLLLLGIEGLELELGLLLGIEGLELLLDDGDEEAVGIDGLELELLLELCC